MVAFIHNAYRVLFKCPRGGLKSSVWKPDIAARVEHFADSDDGDFAARPFQLTRDETVDPTLKLPGRVIATVIPNSPRFGG